MKGSSMTEDKASWTKVRHEDVRLGDTVRVIRKDGPQTTVTEGKVTQYEVVGAVVNEPIWMVEDFEHFYGSEFEPDEDGAFSIVERLTPAFEWPTKLGAVVTGKDGDDKVVAILCELDTEDPTYALWWTTQWGSCNSADLETLDDLTVVSEGVTVGG